MRAKKAKSLRKLARDLTVGKPAATYEFVDPDTNRIGAGKHTTLALTKNCTRGVYKRLKRIVL